jgi:hypothetical protein
MAFNSFSQFANKKQNVPDAWEALASGAGDALTFGWGDEALGFGAGLLGMNGADVTDWSRRQQQRAQAYEPGYFAGGQVLGGMAGGMAGGAAIRGLGLAANLGKNVGLLGRVATSAATGALGGGVYGAGSAEDPNRLEGAMGGALIGGGFGAGARVVGAGLGHAYREGVRPALSSSERAAKVLAEMGGRYGQTPQALEAAAKAAAPNATMMDVQKGGVSLVMGAASRPSAQKEVFREALDKRNNGMAETAAKGLWHSAAVKRIDAGDRISDLADLKKLIDYSDIDSMQIEPSLMAKDFVAHHLRSESSPFKGAIADAVEAVRVDNPNVVGLRIVGDQYTLGDVIQFPKFWRTLWTNVRENVADAKHTVRVTGQGRDALRRITNDSSNLRKEIGGILGAKWEAKQSAYRALADEQEQIRFGYDFMKQTLNNGDNINVGEFVSDFAKLSKEQKRWVRQGALARVENVMDMADTQSGRADVLRSILGTKAKIGVLNTVIGGKTASGAMDMRTRFAKLLPKLEQQREYFENSVNSRIGVGSPTADKLAAYQSQIAQTNPMQGSSGILNALWQLVTKPRADKFDEAVSNHILSAMQRNPTEIIAEINAAGGVDKWAKNIGTLARINGGSIGHTRPSVQALAAARQMENQNFRQRNFQDALTNGVFFGVGGNTLASGGQ